MRARWVYPAIVLTVGAILEQSMTDLGWVGLLPLVGICAAGWAMAQFSAR
jgi:hypothetical protein